MPTQILEVFPNLLRKALSLSLSGFTCTADVVPDLAQLLAQLSAESSL